MKITVQQGVIGIEVDGLVPGQTVQVKAINAIGVSDPATYTTPGLEAPAPPTVGD